jgi:hypothetical protein
MERGAPRSSAQRPPILAARPITHLNSEGAPSLCLRSLQTQDGGFDYLSSRPHTLSVEVTAQVKVKVKVRVKIKVPALSQKTRQGRGTLGPF